MGILVVDFLLDSVDCVFCSGWRQRAHVPGRGQVCKDTPPAPDNPPTPTNKRCCQLPAHPAQLPHRKLGRGGSDTLRPGFPHSLRARPSLQPGPGGGRRAGGGRLAAPPGHRAAGAADRAPPGGTHCVSPWRIMSQICRMDSQSVSSSSWLVALSARERGAVSPAPTAPGSARPPPRPPPHRHRPRSPAPSPAGGGPAPTQEPLEGASAAPHRVPRCRPGPAQPRRQPAATSASAFRSFRLPAGRAAPLPAGRRWRRGGGAGAAASCWAPRASARACWGSGSAISARGGGHRGGSGGTGGVPVRRRALPARSRP